ncbi:MAG: tetratricopeptide repeat protein [Thermodesulfobacteriota bacterium]|nr:tetratricopeptide repeat protein [Thermodesulfobacteriota bacterium]
MISIVIPYMHDEWRLKLLKASLESMPGRDVEICIVEVGKSQHVHQDDIKHEAQVRYRFVYSDRPFNKAWVLNMGVKHLSHGEILVLSDGDLVFTPQWSTLLNETNSPVVAWSRLYVLDRVATEQYLQTGGLGRPIGMWRPTITGACGGVNIIPRDVYYETGGMVECFEGWGGEDNATWARLVAFGYPFKYTDCELWHLWHPQAPPSGRRWLTACRMLDWSKRDWLRYMKNGGWGNLTRANADIETVHMDRTPDPSALQCSGARADSNDAGVHNTLARLYAQRRMWNDAVTEYRKALAIDPNNATIRYELGAVYAQKGMVDKSIVEYKRALEINPYLPVAYNNLAVACYEKGDYGKALKYCDKAVSLRFRIHPGLWEALMPYRRRMDRGS